jgi:hypothetical protein
MRITADAPRPGASYGDGAPNLVDTLNWDWRHRYERGVVRAPRGWASDPELARFRYVVEALGALDSPATAAVERELLLVALAERAATGDREATRVVVQHLLACLVDVLRRPRGPLIKSREETLDDLAAAAWWTVAEGVERRGRPIKVALLSRIEHRALHQPRWAAEREAAREELGDPAETTMPVADLSGRPVGAEPKPEEEVLALLVDGARAGLDPADLRLLAALTLEGRSAAEAAAAEGVSARCIRWRRARAARRLAQLAA